MGSKHHIAKNQTSILYGVGIGRRIRYEHEHDYRRSVIRIALCAKNQSIEI